VQPAWRSCCAGLQLCAGESGVTALALRRWRDTTEKALAGEPNAAATRWRISPQPSLPGGFDGLQRQLWQVELLRLRGSEPHSWILEACNAEGHLPLWPSDRLRRQGKDAPPRDKPLVTARMEGQRRVLASVDRAAMRLGSSVQSHCERLTSTGRTSTPLFASPT
jgi:hypothetical protein